MACDIFFKSPDQELKYNVLIQKEKKKKKSPRQSQNRCCEHRVTGTSSDKHSSTPLWPFQTITRHQRSQCDTWVFTSGWKCKEFGASAIFPSNQVKHLTLEVAKNCSNGNIPFPALPITPAMAFLCPHWPQLLNLSRSRLHLWIRQA
jgi:hypothetical protein